MAPHTNKDRARKEQVFKKLRREILAARLKVTLDEQLNRETSPTVKRLSEMKLPPISRTITVYDGGSSSTAKPKSGGRVQYSTVKPPSQSGRVAS